MITTLRHTSTAKLGAIYNVVSKSVSFVLWAPSAFSVKVLLYADPEASVFDYELDLDFNRQDGIWYGIFSDVDCEGFGYEYVVKNDRGTYTCLDPYAKSMAAFKNDETCGRGIIVDMDAPESFPLGNAGLEAVSRPKYIELQNREDAIIYEISVRDFTISPDSHVNARPGTYDAFQEKIEYLKQLGITHIQLMPVLNFYNNNETLSEYENLGTVRSNNYNWGYDPHNYFTPEGWYASNPSDPYARIRELRSLIEACHSAGLGVILDVVYNHMATITLLDNIEPDYYFRKDEKENLTNGSCCGNDLATEKPMVRRLIIDSILHWIKEYNVDGFRFDLMGLIDTQTILDAYSVARSVNESVLFIGEGWKLYTGPKGTWGMDQNYMDKTDSVAVFNDEFRDLIKAGGMKEDEKGLITGKPISVNNLISNMLGKPLSNYTARSVGNNVNYIAAHDGLTLHDSISYNTPLHESDEKEKAELISRIKLGNFIVMVSRGIAFIHGGQERGRTKPNVHNAKNETIGKFVHNSYDASDSINQFIWNLDSDYQSLLSYTQSLIAFRKENPIFRFPQSDKEKISYVTGKYVNGLSVLDKKGKGLAFGYQIHSTKEEIWTVLVNASKESVVFPVKNANTIVFPGEGMQLEQQKVILAPLSASVLRN